MKKLITITMILCLCFGMMCAFSGCNKDASDNGEAQAEQPKGEIETDDAPQTGGWTVNGEFDSVQIPEDAQKAFEKAMEGYTGDEMKPAAYLGSQVVAGVNYAYLCVTADPVTKLSIVTVYKDLDDNSEVLNVTPVEITNYTGDEAVFDTEERAGGWTAENASGAVLPEDVQTAFDTAVKAVTDVDYMPLAYLGSQVVAGQNYAVLCTATTDDAEPNVALAVVIIYADLSGEAKISSVSNFNIA